MKYDFDTPVVRKGTNCLKWDAQGDSFYGQEGLLPFWIADTDFATEPRIMQAMEERLKHPCMGYCDVWPDVYASASHWFERRHNVHFDPKWMFAAGSIVTTMIVNFTDLIPKGDKILVFTPVYDCFFRAIENSGHEVVRCDLDYNNGLYTINWDNFTTCLGQGVKGVIFCNPHNPVGRVWTEDEVRHVSQLCHDFGVYLFCDEIHSDYWRTQQPVSVGNFPEYFSKTIIYNGPSKAFNIAGMQCSLLIVPDDGLRGLVTGSMKRFYMFNPTELSMIAMQAAFTYGDEWMDQARAYVNENAAYVESFIAQKMPKMSMSQHQGTFLLWLDMRCFGMDSNTMSKILACDYGIAVASGEHYGSDGFMRLNIGCSRNTLAKGMAALERFYNKYVK